MLEVLDADAVRRWCAAGLDALVRACDEINELNVYPVPDGDTGTNLVLTMRSVTEAVGSVGPVRSAGAAGPVRSAGPAGAAGSGGSMGTTADAAVSSDLTAVLSAVTRGALMGARGNSGVILSQLFRGLAEGIGGAAGIGPGELCAGLRRAAELGHAAVAQPVEGTVLTVACAAAQAAEAAEAAPGGDLATVVEAVVRGATEALAATPTQLPALARAGVVDAGGRGLVVLLEALRTVVAGPAPDGRAGAAPDGRAGPAPDGRAGPGPLARDVLVARDRTALAVAREAGSDAFGYEVQYLLDAPSDEVDVLRGTLDALGDSLVVVGGDGVWNVHVHVNDVGAAVEAGVAAGRPHRITVTRFADQIAAGQPRGGAHRLVAVVPGRGVSALFEVEGAVTVDGGPGDCPSTAQLLAAIRTTGATEVALLPNDGNVRVVAEQAATLAREHGTTVAVIPTRSVVQGLAALAVHDGVTRFGPDVIAMSAAAGATRSAELTTAARAAETPAGPVSAGRVLGLIDGEVAVSGDDPFTVAAELLNRMLTGGGELVTLVAGVGAPPDLAARLAHRLAESRPGVETHVYDGGQPHYPLLIGVE